MMMKYIASAVAIAAFCVPSASALSQADIKRCNAMSASFTAKKAEMKTAKEALDAKAAATEEAGERWEAAEQMKLMSPKGAMEATEAKAVWDELKKDVMREQMALQSQAQMLNRDVAAFNASCATKK